MNDYLIIGKILKPHGVKGMIKIASYMHCPEDIFATKVFYKLQKFFAIDLRLHQKSDKQNFICSSSKVLSRLEAEKLHSCYLYMLKSALPSLKDGEFYIEELKNMFIVNDKGQKIGYVHEMYNFGAGDIVEIYFDDGKLEMYSFNQENFPQVDLKKRQILFIPPIKL